MKTNYRKCALLYAAVASGVVPAFVPAAMAAPPRACFDLPDAPAGSVRGKRSSSRPVTLADRISTDPRCQYALDPAGPWIGDAVKPGEEETDFASLALRLGSAASDGGGVARPAAIFARPKRSGSRVPGHQLQSVFLAGCTEYLLGSGQGFALSVPVQSQRAVVERVSGQQSCGASRMSLHFVAIVGSLALDVVSQGPWQDTLAQDASSIELEPGSWAVYAARAGAKTGLLIGRIRAGSSLTPLRQALRAIGAGEQKPEPWMRVTWAEGAYRLEPLTVAVPFIWEVPPPPYLQYKTAPSRRIPRSMAAPLQILRPPWQA